MPVLILLNWVILIINLCSCLSNHLNGSELTCQFHLPFPKSLVDMTNCSCTCHFVACHANIASCTHPYHCHPLNAQRRPTIVATPPLPLAMRRLNKRPAVHVVSPYPPYRYCHRGPMAASSMSSSSLLGGVHTTAHIVMIPGSEQRLHLDTYLDPYKDYIWIDTGIQTKITYHNNDIIYEYRVWWQTHNHTVER